MTTNPEWLVNLTYVRFLTFYLFTFAESFQALFAEEIYYIWMGHQNVFPAILPPLCHPQNLQVSGLRNYGTQHHLRSHYVASLYLPMRSLRCLLPPSCAPYGQMLGQIRPCLRPRSICESLHPSIGLSNSSNQLNRARSSTSRSSSSPFGHFGTSKSAFANVSLSSASSVSEA
jgi:hypothetical protein